jgi:hypothetical protein
MTDRRQGQVSSLGCAVGTQRAQDSRAKGRQNSGVRSTLGGGVLDTVGENGRIHEANTSRAKAAYLHIQNFKKGRE